MTKFKVFLLFLLIANIVSAQTRQLQGSVTDPANKGVPSATVKVKGSKAQAITDADGKFSLSVPTGRISLEITSIGFELKEVALAESDNNLSVSMVAAAGSLGEVVVTALGIKREKKMLTYASQQVSGDEMRKAQNANFMEGLSGKAAGLDIRVSSSGAGGSTKAVLRGNKSLLGTSEALYVIDGIPMVNNKRGQPGSYGGTDGGDGLSQINPADIESINILRGANASILYGSLGANGVILITTKKGKAGRAIIDFNSSLIMDKVSGLPDFQYEYGAVGGSDYNWSTTKNGLSGQNKFIEDFFQTGTNFTNQISVSGGNDKTTAYFSYANSSAKGVMPTNTYIRHNITLNQSTKLLNDKLIVSSNVMFTNEESKNRPGAGYYNNPLTGLYLFARERNFESFKTNYQRFDSSRNLYRMNWYSTEEKQNNPYWELNKNSKLTTTNRVIANVKLSYDVAKHLKFDVRGNIDYADKLYDYRYAAAGNSVSVSPNGSWNYTKVNDQSIYSDAILSYNNNFGDISLTAIAGASYQKNTFNDGMSVSNGTNSLMYPNFFAFTNIPYNVAFNQSINRVEKQGVFSNVQLGFKEMLFLDLAARNDWASTLTNTGNESYLYPAVGLSAIISEMFKMDGLISFLKVRASWTETANEVPFNVVQPWHVINGTGGPTGIGGIARNTQVPFTNLKPEVISGTELGLEMKMFKGRAGIDFTYYNDISTNQFLTLSAPSGSGFTFYYVNAGKIVNKGIELTIDGDPIRTTNFRWKTAINLSQNKNEIVELIASNPNFQVGGDDEGFASIIKAGGSFNDVYIFKFNRDANGSIILDANGVPTKAATQVKVGNVNPDFMLGWNNTLNYKNFFGTVLVNAKVGGVAFSKTEAFLDSYGVSQRSADARSSATMPIDAVQGGTKVTSISPVVYYSTIGDRNKIMEPYIFSRTNVRLGQLVLGYTVKPNKPNSAIKDASFSLIGRNLFFFYKEAPYDPEQSMSTSNSQQSNDVFGVPSTLSYGFNIKVTF